MRLQEGLGGRTRSDAVAVCRLAIAQLILAYVTPGELWTVIVADLVQRQELLLEKGPNLLEPTACRCSSPSATTTEHKRGSPQRTILGMSGRRGHGPRPNPAS